ncbi:MAG: hypothetical protein HC788_02430 [Sphingopyxis sp.]|nr:hypothetical protein [Sphingopyxis sp.]
MNGKIFFAHLAIAAVPVLSVPAYAHSGDLIPNAAVTAALAAVDHDSAAAPGADMAGSPSVAAPAAAAPALPSDTESDAVADDDLLLLRGGETIVVGNQTLTAISNGNAFNGNYVAGNIALTDNALSNFNGIGNVLMNTGAQNNLQSAMNVTINIAE